MAYYEVLPADMSYKRPEPLTYEYDGLLAAGQLVQVALKHSVVNGVVAASVRRPKFKVKPILRVYELPTLPDACLELVRWMSAYYAAGIGEAMQQLLPVRLDQASPTPSDRQPQPSSTRLPQLTAEQRSAVEVIGQSGTYLLHGDTGSGKTRVYVELAQRASAAGQSSIILTPEIGLTPQLVDTLTAVFGANSVVVTHSQLTPKQRREAWLRQLHASRPLIVVGPRSALFGPLAAVGLIVMDEAHDGSYKQEQSPRYHTTSVAARLAALHSAPLVLGSGTPALTDYYLASQKQRPVIRMRERARAGEMAATDISVVDLKRREAFSRQAYLSNQLLDAISRSLAAGEQSLVLLNRRGTARVVLCERCGWQASCERCDLPLTYHGDTHQMRCHTCGLIKPGLTSCPACGSADIILKSVGTKAITAQLQAVFPEARISRFDKDNTKSERLEAHYEELRSGSIDIAVGTQLLAKGLDLPLLSTVGVVLADTSLYFPDYTAQERTYQLLRQVIGRVGRGHRPGRVILQSYAPDSPLLKAAVANDWEDFAATELAERKTYLFPPYCFLLKLSCRRATSAAAERVAKQVIVKLQAAGLPVLLEGPAPSFHEKSGGKYEWQIIAKAKRRDHLLHLVSLLPANWTYDLDPSNLL